MTDDPAALRAELTAAREEIARLRGADKARRDVCEEIIYIMRVYDEQSKSGYGVDTPGGLEHMGDVWRLLDRWRDALAAGGPDAG